VDITNPAPVHNAALFLRRWVVNAFGFRTNYHNEASLFTSHANRLLNSQVLKSVREAVGSLIRSAGLSVRTFSSAQDILASLRKELPSCLVLDIELPDINGFELQQELAKKDIQIPIIFLTGHGDIPTSVRQSRLERWSF
jgi:DNA-binding NtrC family response regulator